MTAPHIVDPTRVLGDLLSEASPDMVRKLLRNMINALLSADADAICGAEWASPQPTGWPSATATATAPRHPRRHRRRRRPEAAVWQLLPRMAPRAPQTSRSRPDHRDRRLCYLAGVSTRRMDKLVKTLGIDGLSKSQVSRMATALDEHVT